MKRRVVWTIGVPLLVIAVVAGCIIGIGELLLTVRAATGDALTPVWVALALTIVVALVATFLSATGQRPQSSSGSHH